MDITSSIFCYYFITIKTMLGILNKIFLMNILMAMVKFAILDKRLFRGY